MSARSISTSSRRRLQRSRQELIEAHLELADRLSRRFHRGPALDDDLRQVARLGLVLAADRYDPQRGEFDRFATVTILGELKKYLRSTGWAVHVPRCLQEDCLTVIAAVDRLTAELGRSPRISEVARSVGMEPDRVLRARRAAAARFAEPTDPTSDAATSFHVGCMDCAEQALVGAAVSRLEGDDRRLLSLRFDAGLNQREIAERVGISQPQVHRRIKRALERLREELRVH